MSIHYSRPIVWVDLWHPECRQTAHSPAEISRSMTVLIYRPVTGKIEELANDEHPHWMTGVEFMDEYNFVGSDDAYNVFTCRR